MKKVSILLHCYNEETNVGPISEAIVNQMSELPQYQFEIVFIDNDSKDRTREIIRDLCAKDERIKAIFNAKNYGQLASPYYGMMQCTGDCTITMACDFQDPVELIPKYLEEWENGYKIVLCQKTSTTERGFMRAARNYYYKFMQKHSSIDFYPQVTGAGLYDRSFIDILRDMGETRPFIRGIVAELGYSVKLIPFTQPKRRGGKSSNNLSTYLDLASQSITAYTKFGCRLALYGGFFLFILSLITTGVLTVLELFNGGPDYNFSMVGFAVLAVLISLNMFFIGVVGEYVMDVNLRVRKRPLVIEAERINFDKGSNNN